MLFRHSLGVSVAFDRECSLTCHCCVEQPERDRVGGNYALHVGCLLSMLFFVGMWWKAVCVGRGKRAQVKLKTSDELQVSQCLVVN